MRPCEVLMDHRGLGEDVKESLRKQYLFATSLYSRPEAYTRTPNEAVELINHIDYMAQQLWGFTYDPKHWNFEFGFRDCKCPIADNLELLGTDQRIYNDQCVLHGKDKHKTWEELK